MWLPAVYIIIIVGLLIFCMRALKCDSKGTDAYEHARERFLQEANGDHLLIQKALEATSFEMDYDDDAPVERVIHHIRRLRLEA